MKTNFIILVLALAVFVIAQVIFKKLQRKSPSKVESNSDTEQMVNAYHNSVQYKRVRIRIGKLMIIVSAIIILVTFGGMIILNEKNQDKQNIEINEHKEQASKVSHNLNFFFYLIPHSEIGYKAHYVEIKDQKVKEAQKALSDIKQEMSERPDIYNQDLRTVELNIHQQKLAKAKAYSFHDYVKNTSVGYVGIGGVIIFSTYLVYLLCPVFRRKKLHKYVIIFVCYLLFLCFCQNMILHEYFG